MRKAKIGAYFFPILILLIGFWGSIWFFGGNVCSIAKQLETTPTNLRQFGIRSPSMLAGHIYENPPVYVIASLILLVFTFFAGGTGSRTAFPWVLVIVLLIIWLGVLIPRGSGRSTEPVYVGPRESPMNGSTRR
jgi:hypothetical protein